MENLSPWMSVLSSPGPFSASCGQMESVTHSGCATSRRFQIRVWVGTMLRLISL